MKNLIENIKRICRATKALIKYIRKDESALLYLLEEEAKDYLKKSYIIGTSNTEEIEDLLFHIKSYLELPDTIRALLFPNMRKIKFKINNTLRIITKGEKPSRKELETFIEYITEVERQRAVERDFICEQMKNLPLEFKI